MLEELLEKERAVSSDMDDSRNQSEKLKQEYDKLAEEIHELELLISEKQNAASESMMDAGNLEGRIGVLNEQIRAEEMNAEHIKNRIASIEFELNEKEDSRKRYQAEKDAISGQVKEMRTALENAEQALTEAAVLVDELEQTIEEDKTALIGALNEKSSLSVKKQRYVTLLEQVQVRRSEVVQKLLKVKTDEENWETQIRNQEEILERLDVRIGELLELADQLEAEVDSAGDEIQQLNKELNNRVKELENEYKEKSTTLDTKFDNRKRELEKEFKEKTYDMEYEYKSKVRKLEKENSKLHRIIDKFYETIDRFIHWICEKFDMGAEDNLIRDFEKETKNSLEIEKVEKQIKKEDREKEWELEI